MTDQDKVDSPHLLWAVMHTRPPLRGHPVNPLATALERMTPNPPDAWTKVSLRLLYLSIPVDQCMHQAV